MATAVFDLCMQRISVLVPGIVNSRNSGCTVLEFVNKEGVLVGMKGYVAYVIFV